MKDINKIMKVSLGEFKFFGSLTSKIIFYIWIYIPINPSQLSFIPGAESPAPA